MTGRGRPWGYLVAGASIVLYVVAALGDRGTEASAIILFGIAITSFGFVGAFLTTRVRGNVIGPLLLAAAASMSVGAACGTYALTNGPTAGATPLVVVAGLANQVLFFVPIVIVLIGVPLVFPDGRFLTARWRWIAGLTIVAMVALTAYNLGGAPELDIAGVTNPLYAPELVPLLEAANFFASLASVVGFGGAALSVVLRYRRGSVIERQQVKWLAAVATVAGVALPISILLSGDPVADIFFTIGFGALVALPFAVAIAVVRYRLFEIDRFVSRTIGWAVVTGVLLAVFAAGVVGLQAMLADVTQGETLAVAASTLVAFALFQPVRRRVQRAVDRRFDRARYDAERTAAAFAGRLRDHVDLERTAAELVAAADGTLRPASSAVWLRATGGLG